MRIRQHSLTILISMLIALPAFAATKEERRVTDSTDVVDQLLSLDALRQMNSAGRKSMLQAVSNTITHDGKLTLREAELLRAICASLDCPLPPILQATLK